MFAKTEPPTSTARRNRGDARSDVAARQAETPEWTPYGADRKAEARELVSLLKSPEVFETALAEIVNDHFGISNWTLFCRPQNCERPIGDIPVNNKLQQCARMGARERRSNPWLVTPYPAYLMTLVDGLLA